MLEYVYQADAMHTALLYRLQAIGVHETDPRVQSVLPLIKGTGASQLTLNDLLLMPAELSFVILDMLRLTLSPMSSVDDIISSAKESAKIDLILSFIAEYRVGSAAELTKEICELFIASRAAWGLEPLTDIDPATWLFHATTCWFADMA